MKKLIVRPNPAPAPRNGKAKKAAAAAAAVCALAAGGAGYQRAFADPTWNPHCCGETVLLGMILSLMEFNDQLIYSYLISGTGDVGTGIVGTISANAQSQMSHNEAGGGNLAAHDAARKREVRGEQVALERNVKTLGDPRECQEGLIKQQLGARAGSGEAALYAMNSSAKYQAIVAESLAKTPSESASAAAVMAAHKSKFCGFDDAKAGRCGTSQMPDGDIRVQSLFGPAGNYTAPAAGSASLTFQPQHEEAAGASAVNIMGAFAPPVLPKAVSMTPAGRMYAAKYKIFESRLSPANMVLTGIAGRRAPATLSGGAKESWDAVKGEYSAVLPQAGQAPDNPSEAELLRFEVMRRYAGSKWLSNVQKSGDPAAAMREVAYNDAVELKVLYDMHQRLEEDNAVLAGVLAQMTNPVTRQGLNEAAATSYRTKQ